MKKLISAALALLFCAGASAQGVDFRNIAFEQALAAGKRENKPVFIDFYAMWCGPCLAMAKEVFTLREAGDYFNKNFVCIKFDTEKGEGPGLAKKYGIKSLPTFLVLAPDGSVIQQLSGSDDLEGLIARVNFAIDGGKLLADLEKEYENGTIGRQDLARYWAFLRAQGRSGYERAVEAGERLYNSLGQAEKVSGQYWPLLSSRATSVDSQAMGFILANRKSLDENIGKESVDAVVDGAFRQALHGMVIGQIRENTFAPLPALEAKLQTIDTGGRDSLLALSRVARARSTGDPRVYVDALEKNNPQMQEMMRSSALFGAGELLMGEVEKEIYARLAAIAHQLSQENPGPGLDKLARQYTRMSHVGVLWEAFGTFEEALAQARRERKPVFLYCYAATTDDAFARQETGDFFNARFINIKLDMTIAADRGVAEKFGVRALPAFLVINSDGTLQHMAAGGGQIGALLEKYTRTL